MAGRRWADLSPRARTAVLALAAVQVSLAATAWTGTFTAPVTGDLTTPPAAL